MTKKQAKPPEDMCKILGLCDGQGVWPAQVAFNTIVTPTRRSVEVDGFIAVSSVTAINEVDVDTNEWFPAKFIESACKKIEEAYPDVWSSLIIVTRRDISRSRTRSK